jgi:hypothetical protein
MRIEMRIIIALITRKVCIWLAPFCIRIDLVSTIADLFRNTGVVTRPEPYTDAVVGCLLHDVPATVICVETRAERRW